MLYFSEVFSAEVFGIVASFGNSHLEAWLFALLVPASRVVVRMKKPSTRFGGTAAAVAAMEATVAAQARPAKAAKNLPSTKSSPKLSKAKRSCNKRPAVLLQTEQIVARPGRDGADGGHDEGGTTENTQTSSSHYPGDAFIRQDKNKSGDGKRQEESKYPIAGKVYSASAGSTAILVV